MHVNIAGYAHTGVEGEEGTVYVSVVLPSALFDAIGKEAIGDDLKVISSGNVFFLLDREKVAETVTA